MDVFFYEAFEEEEAALRKYLGENVSAGFTWKTIQEYGESTPPAKVISVRTQSVIPKDWSLQIDGIVSRSTGYDHLKAYRNETRADLACGYLPLYCNRAVAEHALMLWLNIMRKLNNQVQQFSKFHRDGITGEENEKKRLLVVGVGNIGYEIVKIGKGLNMKVKCVDLNVKYPDEHYVNIDEGLKTADIVVCAMNLNETNKAYFNYDRLKQTKKGCIFINISRGEISPAQDLLKLIDEQHLGGVGMDVFDEEKDLASVLRGGDQPKGESVKSVLKMMNRDNVILTPHNAFNTVESVERKSIQSVEQVNYFLKHQRFIWGVPE